MSAEAILELLAKLRQAVPYELVSPPPRCEEPAVQTVDDFEAATVVQALEQLTVEVTDAVARAHEKVLGDALRVYYAAEELARDPANAHLIPHVEAMRAAFLRDYGTPIPPRAV